MKLTQQHNNNSQALGFIFYFRIILYMTLSPKLYMNDSCPLMLHDALSYWCSRLAPF